MKRRWRPTNAPSIVLLGFAFTACHGGQRVSATAAAPSRGQVDSFRVVMPELGDRARMVRVYLPPGYARGGRTYPVLYMQDAQQIFAPGAYGDWKVDETLDQLVAEGRSQGLIVVGVDNGERRWDEYGPWVNRHMRDWIDSSWARPSEGGEGDAYVRFLTSTLKPEIDRRYRTRRDRANTGIGGSSMGGLIALRAGLTRPDVFSKVMAMSTAVWFAEDGGPWLSHNQLLASLDGHAPPRDVRFYLDVGTEERSRDRDPDVVDGEGKRVTYPRAYLDGSRAVAEALAAHGVPAANLRFEVDRGAIHNESAWSRRLPGALEWLYQ